MPTDFRFYIPDITCDVCSQTIIKALDDTKWKEFTIQKRTVNSLKKMLLITLANETSEDIVRQRVEERLHSIGYPCKQMEVVSSFYSSHRFLGILGLSLGLLIMTWPFLGLPFSFTVMTSMTVLCIPLTAFLGWNFYYDAFKKMIIGEVNMNTLFTISTLTVMTVSVCSLFFPQLPMMFDAALFILGFNHIGLAIKESFLHSLGLIQNLGDALPQQVRQIIGEAPGAEERWVDLTAIGPGDVLFIHPGELIPVDGISLSDVVIDSATFDGSAVPKVLRAGEAVVNGTRLTEDSRALYLKASARVDNSYLAREDKLLDEALFSKGDTSPNDTVSERLKIFIPVVLGIALLSAAVVGAFFPFSVAISCAAAVLVSACPCTIGLIIPLAEYIGRSKARKCNVLFKSAQALQNANAANAVVFDLNGTLTKGKPRVEQSIAFADTGFDSQRILGYAASLEKASGSSHPFALAIMNSLPGIIEAARQNTQFSHHAGVAGWIDDELYVVGDANVMQENDLKLPEGYFYPTGGNLVYLANLSQKQVKGYLLLRDEIREQARETIQALTAMGKKIFICTGAHQDAASYYAQQLNIDEVRANCRGGEDKLRYLRELRERGYEVAMVGDAGNDALPVEASTFGIAILSPDSNAVTQSRAGAEIQNGSLWPIVNAFEVARQTSANIHQSFGMSLIYNIIALTISGGGFLAMGFALSPAVGAAFMAFQSSLIFLNAYRFREQKMLPEPTEPKTMTSSFGSIARSISLSLVNEQRNQDTPGLHRGFYDPLGLNVPPRYPVDGQITSVLPDSLMSNSNS